MLAIFSVCELITFPQAQSRTFNEVCANDKYYEDSIFEYEDPFNILDDSDDGIDNSALRTTVQQNESCTYHLKMPEKLKERTLAFFNRIRWLTGYKRNITWDADSDVETCHCAFAQLANFGTLGHGERDGRCTDVVPNWRKGCQNSNIGTYPHNKMSYGVRNQYNEGNLGVGHRNLMLSPILSKTSMCATFLGKETNEGMRYADFLAMNTIREERLKEEIPFIAAPPPGYIPYYMMPSVVSLLAKGIQNPQVSDFKVYYNGELISGRSRIISSDIDNMKGYSFATYPAVPQKYNHKTGQVDNFGTNFIPGSVFRFEATNNGNTYAWNTTLVDCAKDSSSKYPDPTPVTPAKPDTDTSSNSSMPENPSNTTTETEPTNNTKTEDPKPDNGDPSSQKSGLTGGQKAGIGIGVTLGVAAVAGAVVGGLVFAGAIGGGSAAGGGAAAAGASAAGASAAAV